MGRRWLVLAAFSAGCPDSIGGVGRDQLATVRAMTALDQGTVGIRDAIVRGDLYDARRRAGQLGNWLPPLPHGTDQALRASLSELRSAPTLEEAAVAFGRTAQACADCHTSVAATVVRPPWIPSHDTRDPLQAEMARHAMAVDGLWLGMIGPSDQDLHGALEVLDLEAGAPDVPARIRNADEQVRALASAVATSPLDGRPKAYAKLLMACAGCHAGERAPPPPRFDGVPMPNLEDAMEEHFFHALQLELHLMSGDLERARGSAALLETAAYEGIPPAADPHLADIRAAAGRAARATTLAEATAATADVVAACGRCHVATGGGPTEVMRPAVGERHMALHLYGAYWMGYAVVAADEHAWSAGAEAFGQAPLGAGDPELVVHTLATRAATVADWPSRANLWGEILGSCAPCHRELAQ